MEQKFVKVPFNLEKAKKIQNKECEGRIVTRGGSNVRILCWDKKDKTYPIAAFVDNGYEEDFKTYTNEGIWNTDKTCTVKEYDLFLEVPEYMTFKDGDILFVETEDNKFIFIKKNGSLKTHKYVSLINEDSLSFVHTDCCYDENIKILRKATPEEIEKIKAWLLKDDRQEAKECLKKFFGIEQKKEHEFKPFDKVLVRDANDGCWHADIFSHKNKDRGRYYCTGYEWRQCIPYNDQTAHLIGTTDNWE